MTKSLTKPELNLLAYPILASLGRCPKTLKQLSHQLLMSQNAVTNRLKQLQDQGLVVRRSDNKWQMIVGLRPERAPDVPSSPEETVELGVEDWVETPQDGSGRAAQPPPIVRAAESRSRALQRQPVYKPPKPPEGCGSLALKVMERMRVPATLKDYGEASIGSLAVCVKCSKGTPLKYGRTPICPLCARGGSNG
jgi:biotin operon repressor